MFYSLQFVNSTNHCSFPFVLFILQVKIWFQNRRARFRRENNSSSFSPHRDHPPPSSIGFAEKVAPETGIHFSSTASKQSFRHLINDLNLMAAGAVIHANLSKN